MADAFRFVLDDDPRRDVTWDALAVPLADDAHGGGRMIAKPAMLECARCGKIFIGWKTDGRPKSAPTCLKCQAKRAWEGLASAMEPTTGRGAGGKRTSARKSKKRSFAAKPAGKRSVAKAVKRRTAKAKRSR